MKFEKFICLLLTIYCLLCAYNNHRINAEIKEINCCLNEYDLALAELQNLHNEESTPEVQTTYLGKFKITAYCHCAKCCGKSDGITATGTKVAPNRTIAVDPNVILLGSQVMIDGQIYIAEDVGGSIDGNRIDMYFPTHQEALAFGVQYKDVSILKEV